MGVVALQAGDQAQLGAAVGAGVGGDPGQQGAAVAAGAVGFGGDQLLDLQIAAAVQQRRGEKATSMTQSASLSPWAASRWPGLANCSQLQLALSF